MQVDGVVILQIWLITFALNSARKSKCFLRSVARMASMTRKRKRLNSTCSRLTRKLYSGRDMKRFHAEAAWWFSNTERSLYRRAYRRKKQSVLAWNMKHIRPYQGWHIKSRLVMSRDTCSHKDSHQCSNCPVNITQHFINRNMKSCCKHVHVWKGWLTWSFRVSYVDFRVNVSIIH